MSSSENILDLLYDMCRLCLERAGHYNLFSNNYTQIIAECAGVQVALGDELPQCICEVCAERLRMCKALRTLAKQTDMRLRLLRDGKSRPITESDTNSEFIVPEVLMKSSECTTTSIEPSPHTSQERELTAEENPPNSKVSEDPLGPRIRVRVDIFDGKEDKISTSTKESSKSNQTREKSVQQNDASKNIVSQVTPVEKSRLKAELKPKTEDLSCEICAKVCANTKALYLHRRGHTKNHVCPLCSKGFSTKNDLAKHVRVHTGEKPFQCHICQKSFTQAGTLKSHVEAHEKERQDEFDGPIKVKIGISPRLRKNNKRKKRTEKIKNVNKDIVGSDIREYNTTNVETCINEDQTTVLMNGDLSIGRDATETVAEKESQTRSDDLIKEKDSNSVKSNEFGEFMQDASKILEDITENNADPLRSNKYGEKVVQTTEIIEESEESTQDSSEVLEDPTENNTYCLQSNKDGKKGVQTTEKIEERTTDTNKYLSSEPNKSGNYASDKTKNSYAETMNFASMDDATPKGQKRNESDDKMNSFEKSFNEHEPSYTNFSAIASEENSNRDTPLSREKRTKIAQVHTCKSCKRTFDRNVELIEHRKRHRRIVRFC